MTYGEIIKDKRNQLNLTLKDLTNLSGVSSSYISEIENNKRKASAKIASRLNKVLYKEDSKIVSSDKEQDKSSIEKTLQERGKTYGEFPNVAYTSQSLRSCMTEFDGWDRLNDTQREALTVIAQKIARILNGNPDYLDNWHDIAGYATLVEKSLS